MKIIKDTFIKNIDYDEYFNGQKVCFLDIETTGFSRKYDLIYLIGLVFYDYEKKSWNLVQIFADNKNSEKDLLLKLIDYVKDFDMIISYNGDSFDIPFINTRLKLYDIDFNLFSIENFDIYRFIRENKIYLNFENYKLKTVEKNLGIYRDDIYSGKDCIKFYKDYVVTKDQVLLERILQHNYDDLYYLIDIIKIKDKIDEEKSINVTDGKIKLDNMQVLGDIFRVGGYFYSDKNIKLMDYHDLYRIEINNGKFIVDLVYSLGLVSPEEKGLFIDKNKFALEGIPTHNANYKIPDRFILLEVEKSLFLDNIKNLLSNLLNRSIKNLM